MSRIEEPAYRDAVRELRQEIGTWMQETRYPGPGLSMYRQSRLGRYGA